MSDNGNSWSEWLNNTRFSYSSEEDKQETLAWLYGIRDKILDKSRLKEGETIIDIGTGTGMLAFGAYKKLKGKGRIIASDAFEDCLEECKKEARALGIENEITFLQSDATTIKLPDNSVDVVVIRSVLMHLIDKPKAISEFYRVLRPGGRVSMFEPIMKRFTRYTELITPEKYPNYSYLKEIENKIRENINDSYVNFDENTLKTDLEMAGFTNVDIELGMNNQSSGVGISKADFEALLNLVPSPGQLSSKQKFLEHISENEWKDFLERMKADIEGKVLNTGYPVVFISAEKI